MMGTASYMPPEQIRGGTLAPQSDLYALGCVLHELLTGRRLFTGPTEYGVYEQQIHTAPPRVRRFRPDVPPELDEFVLPLLAKRVGERPETTAAPPPPSTGSPWIWRSGTTPTMSGSSSAACRRPPVMCISATAAWRSA